MSRSEVETIIIKKDEKIEIYSEISEGLINIWNEIYDESNCSYNLSYSWCSTWFKYFGANKSLRIIIVKKGEVVKLLAPMYIRNHTLYLIGSEPDLYDEFNVIYKEEKYISYLIDYIENNNIDIDFRFINTSTDIGKSVVKYVYQKNDIYYSKVVDTKPYINNNNYAISKKVKQDIVRCKNNINKSYSSDVEYIFNLEKEKKFINEFIEIHKKRWNGGPFNKLNNYESFIKDLYLNTNITILSKINLQDGTLLAYHLGYLGSNKIISSSIPAYNIEFKKYSPGKILLFDIINSLEINNINTFDFGRGAEEYKYWYSNASDILVNIKTFNNKNLLYKKCSWFFIKLTNKILNSF